MIDYGQAPSHTRSVYATLAAVAAYLRWLCCALKPAFHCTTLNFWATLCTTVYSMGWGPHPQPHSVTAYSALIRWSVLKDARCCRVAVTVWAVGWPGITEAWIYSLHPLVKHTVSSEHWSAGHKQGSGPCPQIMGFILRPWCQPPVCRVRDCCWFRCSFCLWLLEFPPSSSLQQLHHVTFSVVVPGVSVPLSPSEVATSYF